MLTQNDRASLLGQVFEIAVKRGVLTTLLNSKLGNIKTLALESWSTHYTSDVYQALTHELKETDPNLKDRSRQTAKHLFELGMGLGQTALREYLKQLPEHEDYAVKALWCPLQLPKLGGDAIAEQDFLTAFAQQRLSDDLTGKGCPVNADFLLWLEPIDNHKDRELLCLEFSLNSPPDSVDYSQPAAHLAELGKFASFMESRSVFSRVCAEVSGEEFKLSSQIVHYLPAFTGRDKPFYKLCQAASYICTTAHWLKGKGFNDRPCNARALSITQNGFESVAARFFASDAPRVKLMQSLGRAYRNCEKTTEPDEEGLNSFIELAFNAIRKSLPLAIRQQLHDIPTRPTHDSRLAFNCSETVENVVNPMTKLSIEQALSYVDEDDTAVTRFLNANPKAFIAETLANKSEITLRDLHAAAVIAGMQAATLGQITVLGLEGNPGIGKTTAVKEHLKKVADGFLFLYISPRVIINDDVTGSFANADNGILTLTTNSKLIGSAKTYHAQQNEATNQYIDSAVVAEGFSGVQDIIGSTLILTPAQKEELEQIYLPNKQHKHAITEREDFMNTVPQAGVLRVLTNTACALLAQHSNLNKLVLTASIQSYRQLGGSKSTVDMLSGLFKNVVTTKAGINERRAFAQRVSTIVVMVDELTGDKAGAPLIHSLTNWLTEQFIKPFETEPLFKVILIISDASLGNEIVLNTYLNSDDSAPDKVLISKSQGNTPFRLAATRIKLGYKSRPVLHIMTNSYPAKTLAIDYRVRLDIVKPQELPDGKMQTIRQAIAEQQGEVTRDNIIQEIHRALVEGAEQVIFFAQDKKLLRQIQTQLMNGTQGQSFTVEILDSSVLSCDRKALISDARRDGVKVFLITSSAARGVSFPKTDRIIALIPRFNIEAALMEIAQLIYRGRGNKYKADNGTEQNGDWKDRRLVMLLQDFLPTQEAAPDARQWLRQISDLLTYLVMLRATIYTRITGDAGLVQQLALIPVGGIGTEEMLSLMSTAIRDFLQEADVLLHDQSTSEQQRGLYANAKNNVSHLFSKFSLEGIAKNSDFKSVARIHDIRDFSESASADNALLLMSPQEHPDSVLPAHRYCVGPFWLEHWHDDVDKQERLSFEGWLTDVEQQMRKLLGELSHLSENDNLPDKLRHSAKELHEILIRDKDGLAREFSTIKALKSPATWLAVPVDYVRFWKKDMNDKMPSLGDESAWRDYLGACLNSQIVLPVIPRYKDIPFAVTVGEQDPTQLNLAFDNRYLGVSNELNLLNTILLAE